MCAARFAVISFLLSSGAPCEAALRAKICGVVEDQTRAAIPGIVVKLTSAESSKTTSTDAGGQFCLPDLEPGGYELELRGSHFRIEQRRLELRSGEALQLTITLTKYAPLELAFRNGGLNAWPFSLVVWLAPCSLAWACTVRRLR
jgi:hypothetical protein